MILRTHQPDRLAFPPHLNVRDARVTRVARERLGGLPEDGRRGDGSRLRLPLLPLPADSFHLIKSARIHKDIFVEFLLCRRITE